MVLARILDEAEMEEVARRPELIQVIARGREFDDRRFPARYGDEFHEKAPLSVPLLKSFFLDWGIEEDYAKLTEDELKYYDIHVSQWDEKGRAIYHAKYVNDLRAAYWFFGRGVQVGDVNQRNWRDRYLQFRGWISKSENYMRFDKDRHQFVVDDEAKKADRPLPKASQLGPPPDKPWPAWKGTVPVLRVPK